MTYSGGSAGFGAVFKMSPTGRVTELHSFTGGDDGAYPIANLMQGSNGDLYGTTVRGGASGFGDAGFGTVFSITTKGVLTTLHSFSALSKTSSPPYSNSDGAYPAPGLIQGTDGNLYGMAGGGGAYGYGTVFSITPQGALTTLHSFMGGDDGAYAQNSPLLEGKDGNFYGVSPQGHFGHGTVFSITPQGVLTTLHHFTGGRDGAEAMNLIQGNDGNLYSTTESGGVYGQGMVFKLTMIPIITSFSPTDGPVGASVTLKGHNFTEATAVEFGNVSAGFTINSDTSLTFTVPSPGAKSANITVVNPFGQATSARAFTMTPVISSFSPTSGPVGASVTLTGVSFTGATAVKVGSVSATFTVNSDTSLTLTVPTGARTGKISVVNSFGTGASTKVFKVTP